MFQPSTESWQVTAWNRVCPTPEKRPIFEIGRQIVAGAPPPGAPLADESTLVKRYKVSRSVIRDAVKILVGKGLLDVRRGNGTRVRERSEWSHFDRDLLSWQQSAPPDAHQLRQLIEMRQVIEPAAARWAAQRAHPEQVSQIEETLVQMELCANSRTNPEQSDQFALTDALFHRAILQASGNELLIALEGLVFSAMLGSIRLTSSNKLSQNNLIPYHREVFEAIQSRDAEAAEQCMKLLLQIAYERLNPYLKYASRN